MIEIRNCALPLSAGLPGKEAALVAFAARRLGVGDDRIAGTRLLKRAVDARRKSNVHFVATLGVTLSDGDAAEIALTEAADDAGITRYAPRPLPAVRRPDPTPVLRPVVVGTGPAGLFAALTLARAGARPVVLERGQAVDERIRAVSAFQRSGELDPECNIQFGEGGAGTFSDGKLTTSTNDPRSRSVIETFVGAGAPEEILWQARPHIGTDRLTGAVRHMREEIVSLGGDVRFGTRLTGLVLSGDALAAVVTESERGREEFSAEVLILATGHSARDTFEMLHELGATLVPKPFSLGVRVEHSQELVNRSQYGGAAGHPALGAADYRLSAHLPSGRSAYTFCMCPGGEVVAAASEPGGVVTNGMSRFARDGANANAAFLVNVTPADFGGDHPLAGVAFQRQWEHAAYELGGRTFRAPVQLLGDFMRGVVSSGPGSVIPTYPLGVTYADLALCLPEYVAAALREAVPLFDRRLKGFATRDAVLTG
ncbi:MAG: NAD(P)/FAD-dependent oxidoreductase, partial [Coriobacteriia bacterium]